MAVTLSAQLTASDPIRVIKRVPDSDEPRISHCQTWEEARSILGDRIDTYERVGYSLDGEPLSESEQREFIRRWVQSQS